MAGNPFTKANMFFGLLKRLEQGEGLSIRSLARICKVKEKAAEEYLDFLRGHRDLVSTEEGGEQIWRLKPRGEVRQFDDALAVTFAQVALSSFRGTRVHRSLEAVAGPIHQGISNTDFAVLRHVGGAYQRIKPEPPSIRAETLDAIIMGLHESRRCRIAYAGLRGDKAQREIEPFSIFEHRDVMYVFANNCADGRQKTFDVDRISRVEVLDTRFRPPVPLPDPAELLSNAAGIYMADLPVEDVLLLARDWPAAHLQLRRLHKSQQVEPLAGDLIRIRLRVQCTPDLVGMLLSFLPHVRPVSPPSLVELFNSRLKAPLPI